MDEKSNRKHDPFFRWLFADVYHLRHLLELSGKVNVEVDEFLREVNLDTLVRIPDSYSEVEETGEADLAFRVNVASGAPVLVGILVEHKSGRDTDTLNQLARYVHSVMKMHAENRAFDGLPTMAIIFYNGKANWNPLNNLMDGYSGYFRNSVLPFRCAFVNMSDIPDSDCLACEDTATGMGIVAMKYAYDKEGLLRVIPQFKEKLHRMPHDEASCLLGKISVYLKEYVDEGVLKELDMAFVSIGQKYGFVSAGDVFRKKIADARAEEQAKAQKRVAEARSKAHTEDSADTEAVLRKKGLSEELIAEVKAEVEAMRLARGSQG